MSQYNLLHLKAPLLVQMELTYACNNKCLFCYNVWKEDVHSNRHKVLSFEQICSILDMLKQEEIFYVHFTGGEPTLHPKFIEILEYAYKLGLNPSFATNANAIDKNLARLIKATGLIGLQVSMHASCASLHDYLTGTPGSFEKATNGLIALVEEGLKVNVNMTVNKANLNHIFETAKKAQEFGATSFSVTRFVYSGEGINYISNLGLDTPDQDIIIEEIDRIANELGLDVRVLTPITWCGSTNPEKILGKVSSCDAGLTWSCISPSGELRYCTHHSLVAGSLLEKGISDLWKESEIYTLCRQLKDVSKKCQSCKALPICRGGCRACAYHSTGHLKGADPCAVLTKERINVVNTKIDHLINKQNFSKNNDFEIDLNYNMQRIPILTSNYAIRKEEFGQIMFNAQGYFVINSVTEDVLRLIDGTNTLSEILTSLSLQYSDEAISDIEQSTAQLLGLLKNINIIDFKK